MIFMRLVMYVHENGDRNEYFMHLFITATFLQDLYCHHSCSTGGESE